MVKQLLSAQDLKTQTDNPMMSTNTGAKPGYTLSENRNTAIGLPANKGLIPKMPTPTPQKTATPPMQSVDPSMSKPTKPTAPTNQVNVPVQQGISKPLIPDYNQGVFTPAQNDIFKSPAFQAEIQKRLADPEDNLAKIVNNETKLKGMATAATDLATTIHDNPEITTDELKELFPEFKSKFHQNSMYDLATTIHDNPDITEEEIKDLFPEFYTLGTVITDAPSTLLGESSVFNPMKPIIEGMASFVKGTVEGGADVVKGLGGLGENIKGTDFLPEDKNVAENLTQTAKGIGATIFHTLFPASTMTFYAALETDSAAPVVQGVMTMVDKVSKKINEAPGLSNFKAQLRTEEEKQDFDNLITQLLMLGFAKTFSSVRGVKTGKIGETNASIDATINKAMQPISKLVDDFTKSEVAAVGAPEGSISWNYNRAVEFMKSRGYDVKPGYETYQQFRTDNMGKPNAKGTQSLPGAESTPTPTPTTEAATAAASAGVVAKTKQFMKEYKSELDPSTIKAINSNPYIGKLWNDTMQTIELSGTPTDLNQLIKEPLAQLGKDLITKIEEQQARLSETGPLYQIIRQDKTPVDLNPAQEAVTPLLSEKGIYEGADGKLNFDKSAIIASTDMLAIQKIYDRVMNVDTMVADEILNLRTMASSLAKYDKGVSGDAVYIIRALRALVDEVAKQKLPKLREVDAKYREQLKDINDAEEGLFYRDARRRGELKDNFMSILKNIGGQNRANMLARLEQIMPDLGTRAEAINMIPTLAKVYTTPSALARRVGGRIGGAGIGFAVGGWAGAMIGEKIAEIIGDKIFSGMKKDAIKSIVEGMSPEAKAKLEEINAKIENNETLAAAEKQVVIDLRNDIKKANADNLKSAEDKAQLAKEEAAFKEALNVGDTKGLGLPETKGVKNVNTIVAPGEPIKVGPKGETTRKGQILEINNSKGLQPKPTNKGLQPKVVDNLTETPKKDILSSDVSATKGMAKSKTTLQDIRERMKTATPEEIDANLKELRTFREQLVKNGDSSSKELIKEVDDDIAYITELKKSPKDLQPLYEEARKYKSAEEFVKAKGNTYHGTSQKIDKFSKESLGKSTNTIAGKKGFWFTDDSGEAKAYAKMSGKHMLNGELEIERQTNKLLDDIDNYSKKGQRDKVDEAQREIERLDAEGRKAADEIVMKVNIKKDNLLDYNADGKTMNQGKISEIVAQAKKQGKDGVKFRNISDHPEDATIKTTQYFIFDEGNIQTESQLKQIREEANKSQGLQMKQESVMLKAPEDALIQEARKYKSAEEFVNKYSQDESFDTAFGKKQQQVLKEDNNLYYHGTTNTIDGNLSVSKSSSIHKEGGIKAVYLTKDKSWATNYTKNNPSKLALVKVDDIKVFNDWDGLLKDADEGKVFRKATDGGDSTYWLEEQINARSPGILETKEFVDYIKSKGYNAFPLLEEGRTGIALLDDSAKVISQSENPLKQIREEANK